MTSEQSDEPTGQESSTPAARARSRRRLPPGAEVGIVLVAAVLLAVVVKVFFVQAFYIPSISMAPGLRDDDKIVVEKWSYWSGEPQRGDVVVFSDPGGWLNPGEVEDPSNILTETMAKIGLYPSGGHLVKRVIGVPGDVIKCCDDQGRLIINGVAVDESDYVFDDKRVHGCRGPMTGNCAWKAGPVPQGTVFVMGDNRGKSADSTVHLCLEDETDCVAGHEFVPDSDIVGKVWRILLPFDRAGSVSSDSEVFAQVPDRSDDAPKAP
ncbi:signal peptidase I [Nocardioides acrostichi]|uniref:Signal peptidase I n=1 Tax=Nocardioides acrostichi TaxID=2784339 RepID=A0A930UYP8_9ACTN|nr:signal peptidase I [Nocardioides acrostichi]MBF4160455.1 signal peptidase I [Nocardioides acrostichi]